MLDTFKVVDPTLTSLIFTYTDTDSLHITNDKLELFEKAGLLTKGLGQVSNDCKLDGKIVFEVCLAPKNYMYVYINSKGEVKTVMKCKGIPTKHLKLEFFDGREHAVKFDNSFKKINLKPVNVKDGDGTVKMTKGDCEYFDIVQVGMSRTFNKTKWTGMNSVGGQYYPFV
jgi:hypothetical protein